jgi:hypothetical protein
MLQINDLRIKNGTQPVHTQHPEEVNPLESMPPLPFGMTEWIIIEIEDGFGGERIGIFGGVVGVGVVSPMLREPGPFAAANEVCAKA